MNNSIVLQEALEAHRIIAEQWQQNASLWRALVAHVQQKQPKCMMTIARGSSDNAANFGKYLAETCLGLPCFAAAPSALTLYQSVLQLKDALVVAISQSGASPDLSETMAMAKRAGATTVAIVNELKSPIVEYAEFVIPLYAGKEQSVAATKSYIATLAALLQWINLATDNQELASALNRLPERLQNACAMDWQAAVDCLQDKTNGYVVARGYNFPVAQEAALKLKELCKFHGEAFSGAEVLHGPFALIDHGFPTLMFMQNDAALSGMIQLAVSMNKLGAQVLMAAPEDLAKEHALDKQGMVLPLPKTLHPLCDPLCTIQAFYLMVIKLAKARGLDPDNPRNIKKITETR